MALTTVTTKGQVTIPKEIRDSLHIKSGDKLEIIIKDDEAIIRPISKTVDEVFGILKKNDSPIASVEDMDKAIREKMKKKFS